MPDLQPHTPTREQFKALLARIPAKYGEVIAHTAVLDDFDRMIDQTIAAAEQRGAEPLLKLLEELVDPDDCWFDHHGGCQAHGFISLEPGETCPHQDAKELIRADQEGDGD